MSRIRSRRLRDGVLGLVLLLGVAACTWQGIKPDSVALQRLYISGRSAHVSDKQIARIAAPFLKSSYKQSAIVDLQKKLAQQPWLTDVQVSRHWPDGVVVHVADHRPVANWGDAGVLAADGQIFQPKTRPKGLVTLRGPSADANKVYARYQQLSSILAGHGVHLASLAMAQNGNWQARLDNGLALRLGRQHLAQRMQRFVRYALGQPKARHALADAGYVDLRYSDGFAVGGRRGEQTASARHKESMG